MLDRTLHEFISLYTEKPFDVISEVVRFMCGVINRSSYVIFQSNFAFCDNDTPFTCVVNQEKDFYYVEFWDVDWASFKIEDDFNLTKIANKWSLIDSNKNKIPNWENLTAKEIINNGEFTDRKYFAEKYRIAKPDLQSKLIEILLRYYDENEPFGINAKTTGIVAVIYREPVAYNTKICRICNYPISNDVCLCPNCSEKLIKFTIDEYNLIKEEENNLIKGE